MDYANRLFLEILAERGVTVDATGKFIRIEGISGANNASDAQLRLLNERTARHYETDSFLRFRWATQLGDLVSEIASESATVKWTDRAMFWIRLHGVIWDLRETLAQQFKTLQIDPATYVPPPRNMIAIALETYRAIEAIRMLFTEDELIYADYLRQTNGHPTQAQYAVRWSNANGGQVNDRRRITTIGREFTSADLDAAVLRVLEAHRVIELRDESVVATAFAKRIQPAVARLITAMRTGVTEF